VNRTLLNASMIAMLDDLGAAEEVWEVFRQTTQPRLDELSAALGEGDRERVRAIAHSLKGAAAQAGAKAMSELSAELERGALSLDDQGVIARIEGLQVTWSNTLEAFRTRAT